MRQVRLSMAAALVFVLSVAFTPAVARANPIENLLDVSWTIGKSKEERDRIILERRARRYAKKVGRNVNDGVKSFADHAREFGKNVRVALNKKYPSRG